MASTLVFPFAAACAVLATMGARALAWRYDVVARPGPIVPQHTQPVPLLGGLGVAAGVAASLIVLGGRGVSAPLLVGAFGFLAVGLLDDLRPLTAARKLLAQVAVASAAIAVGLASPLSGSEPVGNLLSLLWIVVAVNAVNVTDVCDGLTVGLALVSLLGLAALAEPALVPLCLASAGACLGFLVFNVPQASIFLGETGTALLGFLLAGVTIESVRPSSSHDLASAVLVVGVFLFELVFVVAVRLRRGKPWWLASADHFALRLQTAGLSRWHTDAVAWFVALALALGAIAVQHVPGPLTLVIVGSVAAFFGVAWCLLLRWEPAARPHDQL